jgi:hypothetical protein
LFRRHALTFHGPAWFYARLIVLRQRGYRRRGAPGVIMAALASVVLAAQLTGERGGFRRDRHHTADNHHGGWLDAFVR